jgi:hypothetical protein
VSIINFTRSYDSIADIPEDECPNPLGTALAVRDAISSAFPDTNWTDPTWGVFDAPSGSIEFNVGVDDPIQGIMLHIRASEEVVPLIVKLCRKEGWQPLDISGGCFLEKAAIPEAGLQAWQQYRDRVIGSQSD